jgi:hypothetical protein
MNSKFGTYSVVALLSILLATTGCERRSEQPKIGSLVRKLTMYDTDGKQYGLVELDPVRGGRIYDAQGQLIGLVVAADGYGSTSAPASSAPPAAPAAAAPANNGSGYNPPLPPAPAVRY